MARPWFGFLSLVRTYGFSESKSDRFLLFQAHSSVEKAGLIGLVKMRYIESDDQLCLRGDRLLDAIARDKERGLIPFFVSTE
jgi:hypothetical protein